MRVLMTGITRRFSAHLAVALVSGGHIVDAISHRRGEEAGVLAR